MPAVFHGQRFGPMNYASPALSSRYQLVSRSDISSRRLITRPFVGKCILLCQNPLRHSEGGVPSPHLRPLAGGNRSHHSSVAVCGIGIPSRSTCLSFTGDQQSGSGISRRSRRSIQNWKTSCTTVTRDSRNSCGCGDISCCSGSNSSGSSSSSSNFSSIGLDLMADVALVTAACSYQPHLCFSTALTFRFSSTASGCSSSSSSSSDTSASTSVCNSGSSDDYLRGLLRWGLGAFSRFPVQTIAAALLLAHVCCPEAAHAAEAAATSSDSGTGNHLSASILRTLVDDEQALGPFAPAVYFAAVFGLEAVPLLLGSPVSTGISLVIGITRARLWLSLLAGLFFGPVQGALLNLAASVSFATFAFVKARQDEGPTKLLASLQEEDTSGTLRKTYDRIKGVIDGGKLWQQAAVITVVRITPFAPFRSTSYFLGLTPIRPLAYVIGTAAGRGFWSVLYAAIGAYSRTYIQRGVTIDGLASELAEAAGVYTNEAVMLGVVLTVAGTAGWALGVVGPKAPGLPEEGRVLERLSQRRDIAKDGAVGLVKTLVPSEEWLQGDFWRAQAVGGRAALRRALSMAVNDGEGDLNTWLDRQAKGTPLRRKAAQTVSVLRDGAAKLGIDTATLRNQARRLSDELDRLENSDGKDDKDGGTAANGHKSHKAPVTEDVSVDRSGDRVSKD